MVKVVGEQSNEEDVRAAIAENSVEAARAEKQEAVAIAEKAQTETSEIKVSPTEAAAMGEGGEACSANSDNAPKLKNDSAVGLYADIGAELFGGGIARTAKTMVDMVSDMNPAGKGTNNMENFAAPKSSVNTGKKCIFTGNKGFLNKLFGDVQIAGESINGDVKVKGARANQQSVATLQTAANLNRGLQAEAKIQLGNAISHGRRLGAESRQEQQMGMAPGSGNVNRSARHMAHNHNSPEYGPTYKAPPEETGQA